jgi:hypothetical protein
MYMFDFYRYNYLIINMARIIKSREVAPKRTTSLFKTQNQLKNKTNLKLTLYR